MKHRPLAAVLVLSGLLVSCNQEHLILWKNLNRADTLSFESILKESGLSGAPSARPTQPPAASQPPAPSPTPSPVPVINRQLEIPPLTEFTVQLPPEGGNLVLQSLQGGIQNLRDRSTPAQGIFSFVSGERDGRIHLRLYDNNGTLKKNIYYYVRLKGPSAPTYTSMPTAAPTPTPAEEEAPAATNTGNMASALLSSLQGMSPTEAAREIDRMLEIQDLSASDREELLSRLADIQLSQRAFNHLEKTIALMTDPYRKNLYTGRLFRTKRNPQAALKLLISAIGGPDSVKKAAILEAGAVMIEMGSADRGILDRLQAETKKLQTDKAFAADSYIQIARIMVYLPDVYKAQAILESVQNGDYPADKKRKASNVLRELKRDVLEYQ